MLLTSLRRLKQPLAITHVHVVPMDAERVLEDHTVVIEDGRIRTIAPAHQFGSALDGLQQVDGTGKFLLPGLADMHVHYSDPGQANLFLANGVTFVRNMSGAALHLALQRKVRSCELPGPHVATTTPLVDGLDADGRTAWPSSVCVTDPGQAEHVVRTFVERGYQQLKVYQLLTAEAHRALAAAGTAAGLRVTGHCPDGMTFEQAIAHGQTCFEHLTGLATGHLEHGQELPQVRRLASKATFATLLETQRLLAEEVDFDAIRRLAGHLAERQVWNCPTSVVWIRPAQALDEALRDPHLRYMHQETVDGWQQRLGAGMSPERAQRRARLMALQQAGNDARFRAARLLLEAGAPLLLGTDAPNPFVVPGFSIHEELANLVHAGFSPYQALRCGTSEAARFMGEADAWGTIAAGKRADLLLLSANPLEHVQVAARPEAVLVNGFCLDRDQLDALLEERAASVAAKLAPPELEAPPADASIVRHSTLRNVLAGRTNGFISLRCCQLADGGWLAEERRAWGPGQAASRRLWLGADFTVERIDDRYPSPVGEQRYEVHWAEPESTYAVRFVDIDGAVRQLKLGDRRLPPTWGIGLVALPQLVRAATQATRVPALGAAFQARGPDDFAVVEMRVTPVPDDTPDSHAWVVRIDGPAPSERTYRFDAEGQFLELRETMSNGAVRTVVPLEQEPE